MFVGALFGFSAAFCNAVGYLFGVDFLRRYNSPLRLLFSANIGMMVFSAPFVCWLYPGRLDEPGRFAILLASWVVCFMLGNLCFFVTQKYIEPSRLASLLGLKIIILMLIFAVFSSRIPNLRQVMAAVTAAAAAMLMNWSRSGRVTPAGAGFLVLTLIFYCLCDIAETVMVRQLVQSGASVLRSAFFVTALAYTIIGVVSLPGVLVLKLSRPQLVDGMPYAALWLISQALLMTCFGLIAPVFGNIILASRGIFSVLLGWVLMRCGLKLDADISASQWLQRAAAALLMIGAVALYASASN